MMYNHKTAIRVIQGLVKGLQEGLKDYKAVKGGPMARKDRHGKSSRG